MAPAPTVSSAHKTAPIQLVIPCIWLSPGECWYPCQRRSQVCWCPWRSEENFSHPAWALSDTNYSSASESSAKDSLASAPSPLFHRTFIFLSTSGQLTCTMCVQCDWKHASARILKMNTDRTVLGSLPCAASTLDANVENVGSNERPRTPVSSLPPPFPPSSLLGEGSNLIWLITKFPYDLQHSCLITGNLHLLGRPQRGKLTKIFSVKMVQCLWKNSLAVPQMVKHRITTWPSHFIPRYIPKRKGNTHSHKFVHECL